MKCPRCGQELTLTSTKDEIESTTKEQGKIKEVIIARREYYLCSDCNTKVETLILGDRILE